MSKNPVRRLAVGVRQRRVPRRRRLPLAAAVGLLVALPAAALVSCGDDDGGGAALEDAVATYAQGVHASYAAALAAAQDMDRSIDTFLASPSDVNLKNARDAWLSARSIYGPTEVFRFYGGPIDDEETGKEGLINAWPLDEGYVDYVEGAPDSGIINDPSVSIDKATLVSLNEEGGEANVSTGWHAIEFLLWGQDGRADGAGRRPVSDYTTAANAPRRGQYLAVSSDLLLDHLQELVDAWAPGRSNYRAGFEDLEATEAMRLILTGIGEMSRGELAGERMSVAYLERSEEDEHSCFSDNTHNDIIANAVGVQMVLEGNYPGVSGVGVLDAVAAVDADLAERLRTEVTASVAATRAIPAPFDQHVQDGVADGAPGRSSVLAAIEALELQTDTIVDAATALGVSINVS